MTDVLEQLSDRHFRADPLGILADPTVAGQGRVLIAINPNLAATKAGQDTLWMLANLLGRQFRLVTGITLDIPSHVPLLPRVAAFGESLSLRDTIANSVRLVAGQHVDVRDGADAAVHQIEIVIGRPLGAPRAPIRLAVYADGWRLFLGRHSDVPIAQPRSAMTFAPYLAACFAAGEVFKLLRGLKPGKGEFIGTKCDLFLSLWSEMPGTSWNELDPGPDSNGHCLPTSYFAGAGAVAQAAALTIGGLPNITAYATVIDPESLDLSNDNRYALSTIGDDTAPKAPLLGKFLQCRGIGHYNFPGTWQSYVTRQNRLPNRDDLASLEGRYLYDLVLSCLDDNSARHAIQNLWPRLIIGGSTHGLTAKATTYDMAGEQLCLKCYNPVIARNDVVRERFEEARGMDAVSRDAFFRAHGLNPTAANAHLQNPACGQLSEQDLERFASGDPLMSVGFVSVAAGVLLACELVRLTVAGGILPSSEGATLMANFYKPSLRRLRSGPEYGCDCVTRRAGDWANQWRPARQA